MEIETDAPTYPRLKKYRQEIYPDGAVGRFFQPFLALAVFSHVHPLSPK